MFTAEESARILFLDIETVRGHRYFADLSEEMQAMWTHKAQYIKSEEESTAEEKYYERAGIYAEFGRVVCISFGIIFWQDTTPHLKVKSFYGQDEKQVLLRFKSLLDEKFRGWQLCAHNGKEFDFPYLCRRYLINQVPLPKLLQIQGKKPWEVPFLDTMELWKFGDYKNFTKLALLCHVFGIPSPKNDMDGSQVSTVFWESEEIERIARYCEQDVVATAQVFMKYCIFPTISKDHIQLSLAE